MIDRDSAEWYAREALQQTDNEREWRGFGIAMDLADFLGDTTDLTLSQFVELVDEQGWQMHGEGLTQGP